MTATGAAVSTTRARMSHEKLGGLAGIGFAVGVILQNGVFAAGSPLPGDSLTDVATFYTDNSLRVSLGAGFVALNLPFLLIFVTVLSNRLRQSTAASLWGQLAFAGAILISGSFLVVTLLQAVLAARAESLAADHSALGVIWDLHSGAFAVNTASLAILIGALSVGSLYHAIVPRWTAWMGIVAAVLLFVNMSMSVAIIDGSAVMLVGLAGFLMWVVWLLVASVMLLRASSE